MTEHGWLVKNIDNVGDVGVATSIALDSDDHPHISYFDWINENLKYARDPDESFWSVYYDAVDADGDFQSDGVELHFDVDTTYSGTVAVYVSAYLTDDDGQVWATNSTLYSITSAQVELTNLTLLIPSDAPQDIYSIYLLVEDDGLSIEDVFSYLEELTLYPPDTALGGHLQGTVADVDTGAPIAYTEVEIEGATVSGILYTNSSGQYSIALPAGVYNVTVRDDSYESETIPWVTIIDGVTTTQDVALSRDRYVLDVQVQGSGSVTPSVGAYEFLVGSEIEVNATADTGWTFAYWLLDLTNVGSANPHSVTMEADHVLKAVFIEESSIGFCQGTVTDVETAAPIAEAEVVLGDVWLLTDSAGNFSLELEAGTYNIIVGVAEYHFQEAQVEIVAGSTTIQDFALVKVPRTLVVEVIGSGTTEPGPGEHQYASGTELIVDAVPDEGWTLANWVYDSAWYGPEASFPVLMDTDHVIAAVFTQDVPHEPAISSCNSEGVPTTTFTLGESVYATGTDFAPSAPYAFYLVGDVQTWSNGMEIPARLPDTEPTISANEEGTVAPTIIWNSVPTEGEYDLVADVNGNGFYDEGVDALYDGVLEIVEIALRTYPVSWDGVVFDVTIESNATIAAFAFSQPAKSLTVNVTTPFDLAGFCNVTVPAALLGGPFSVLVDGAPVTIDVDSNATHTSLHLMVPSDGQMELIGTTAIPEIPPLLAFAIALAVLGLVLLLTPRQRILHDQSVGSVRRVRELS